MPRKDLRARKRPTQERAVATVQAILQAAAYILTHHGWEQLTTNAVARKAGVNIASLYQYFPNKEAIVAELQRQHAQEMQQRWPASSEGRSLEEELTVLIDAVVSEHRVNPALHRVFSEELPRAVRAPSAQSAAGWVERIQPHVSVSDPELAVFITGTAMHAIIHEAACSRPEMLENPRLIPELVRLLHGFLSGR